MNRTIWVRTLVLLGVSSSVVGCTRADVICDLVCECEHCNDQAKIEACNQLQTAEDVAAAYACTAKWEAYTVCVEDRGTCDENEARFSTRDDAGDDRCQDAAEALDKCIDAASAHGGTSND